MASSTELVEAIARSLVIPAPTVALHFRNLREAGHIETAGRGRNATKMKPCDAAYLLLATIGSRNVKDSADLVVRPGSLVSDSGVWTTNFIAIPQLNALPADHSFVEALTALIESAASGDLEAAAMQLEEGPVDLVHDLSPSLNIEVTIYGPTPRGAIQLEEIVTDSEGRHYRYKDNVDRHFYGNRRVGEKKGNLAWIDVARPKEMDSDLRTSATFTHRTIAAVGQLLSATPATTKK